MRLLEATVTALHLGAGDEHIVLEHLDRAVLRVEIDADREVHPLPLREGPMGLDRRAVFPLIGNMEDIDPTAGVEIDRDDARPPDRGVGRQGRETEPLAGLITTSAQTQRSTTAGVSENR